MSIVNCLFAGNQATGAAGSGAEAGPDFFNRAGRIMPLLTTTALGGGTVTVDPPTPPYLSNSWATMTAGPAAGWQFLYWLGDASGTNQTARLQVTRNKYAQAVFGTALTSPMLVALSPRTDFYPYGTTVRLTALPPTGTCFLFWTGDASGTNNPTTLVITNPTPKVTCQLGALNAGETALTVIEDGRGSVITSPVASHYSSTQTVTLTPVPDQGQDFVGWSGDATGTQNPLVVTMNLSKVITASFTKRPSLEVGTPLEGLVEDGFRLTLIGEFGTNYALLASTNLADWTPVGTVTNTYGTVQFTDPAATDLPTRCYRANSR